MKLDIKKEGDKKTPHLAICHEGQGGSANNRHISLLMKSDTIELTDEIMKSIEKFGVENFPEEIQKAMSMKNHKMLLENALKEAYCDKNEWVCIEDWKDGQVYFTTGDYCEGWDFMVTSFTMTEDGVVTVGDTAAPVVQITDYMIVEGKVKLSEEAEDKLETGMYEIVSKSVSKADAQLKLFKAVTEYKESLEKASTPVAVSNDSTINVNKTKDNTEKPLDFQELQKSAEFQEFLKSIKAEVKTEVEGEYEEKLEKAKVDAEKVKEAEEILKAAIQLEKDKTTEFVKSVNFIAEESQVAMVEFLMKSKTAKSEDHTLVMNVLKAAQEAIVTAQEDVVKTKEQFAITEVGKDGKVVVDAQDPQEVIKAKAAKWAAENKSK